MCSQTETMRKYNTTKIYILCCFITRPQNWGRGEDGALIMGKIIASLKGQSSILVLQPGCFFRFLGLIPLRNTTGGYIFTDLKRHM